MVLIMKFKSLISLFPSFSVLAESWTKFSGNRQIRGNYERVQGYVFNTGPSV